MNTPDPIVSSRRPSHERDLCEIYNYHYWQSIAAIDETIKFIRNIIEDKASPEELESVLKPYLKQRQTTEWAIADGAPDGYTLRTYINGCKYRVWQLLNIEIEPGSRLHDLLSSNFRAVKDNPFLLTDLLMIDRRLHLLFAVWEVLISIEFDKKHIRSEFQAFLTLFEKSLSVVPETSKVIKNRYNNNLKPMIDIPLNPELYLATNRLFSTVLLHIAFSADYINNNEVDKDSLLRQKVKNKRKFLRRLFHDDSLPDLLKIELDGNLLSKVWFDEHPEERDMGTIMRIYLELFDFTPSSGDLRYLDNSLDAMKYEDERTYELLKEDSHYWYLIAEANLCFKDYIKQLLPPHAQKKNNNIYSTKLRNLTKIPLFFSWSPSATIPV